MNKPLVSINCLTYNYAPYIRQCLDGFMMQKADFLFEVLIHDDASTDGTADIIREYEQEYPDIIKPIYQTENQYSKGVNISKTYNYPRAQGEYIAICEGDDYWIDPYKLQKQVNILEQNHEYGLCYTKASTFNQASSKLSKKPIGIQRCSFEDLIYKGNVVPWLTACLRKKLLMEYLEEVEPEKKKWLMGDYPILLWFSYNSKITFMNEVTGVYRILKESASHFASFEKTKAFVISTFDIKLFFLKKYNFPIDEEYFSVTIASSLISYSVKFYNYSAFKEYAGVLRKANTKKIGKHKLIAKSKIIFMIYAFLNNHAMFIFKLIIKVPFTILRGIYRFTVPSETRKKYWEWKHH